MWQKTRQSITHLADLLEMTMWLTGVVVDDVVRRTKDVTNYTSCQCDRDLPGNAVRVDSGSR